MKQFSWLGRDSRLLDTPVVMNIGLVTVGRYGGSSAAGATKNEDGAMIWTDDWVFAVLLDAHASSDSAAAVIRLLEKHKPEILNALTLPLQQTFRRLEEVLLGAFSSKAFEQECYALQGETACLICFQKEQFVWWFSVGDCSLYLFHPELARLGQYALSQRQFFEWIGRENAFAKTVPTYTIGVRELRKGSNYLLMATDGLLEFGTKEFEDGSRIYSLIGEHQPNGTNVVQRLLDSVHEGRGRDSATLLYWRYDVEADVSMPSG